MNNYVRNLPNYKNIKELEIISKRNGSGITYDELIGVWKFNSVYKKGSEEIDNISTERKNQI